MSNFLQFTKTDRTMWLGIVGFSGAAIILLSLFTTTPFLGYVGRFFSAVLIMFLPGYMITKLFFDHIKFSDYEVLDKFLVSFFFSIVSVQSLYFLTTYLRTYGFNVDEDVISSDQIAITLAILVIGAAFGIKFYLNKKKGIPS